MMQQTFARINQSVQAEILPEKGVVSEFVAQVRIMVSYPGFNDEAYPEFLSLSEALAAASAVGDREGVKESVQALVILQNRCHEGRYP